MFPLGHLGFTAAFGKFLSRRERYFPAVDFRLILLGGFLPDFIDKPLYFFFQLGGGRSIGHSLTFNALLASLLLMWSLRPAGGSTTHGARKVLILIAIGSLTHLILDRIWEQPWVVLWPFLGVNVTGLEFDVFLALPLSFHEPYILAGEVIGLAIVLALVVRHRLYRRAEIVNALKTGRLE